MHLHCANIYQHIDWFNFRQLECPRVSIHKNLYVSLTCNNILWLIWYLKVVNNTQLLFTSTVSENFQLISTKILPQFYNSFVCFSILCVYLKDCLGVFLPSFCYPHSYWWLFHLGQENLSGSTSILKRAIF